MTQLYATIAIIGLIITAGDGPLFPWLNFLGFVLFVAGCHYGEKSMQRSTNGNLI